ncbi:MAG TPA: hypothetical protein VJ768_04770, partial [Anaerolineales bacterium]|nr:hypothetical protein [Anaerolineales bacterium]
MLSIIPLAALGLGLGILINYLADVLPRQRRLSHPACFHCGERLPLSYYLVWPQRCKACGKPNPRRFRSMIIDFTAA